MALNKKFFVNLSSIEYGIEEIMIRDDDDSRKSEPEGANLMRNRFSFKLIATDRILSIDTKEAEPIQKKTHENIFRFSHKEFRFKRERKNSMKSMY